MTTTRELTKDEQRRVTDLADFCISRLRPSREKVAALALLRLGEEGERPRELDRVIIAPDWSSEQAIGELNQFARESFNAVTEDARSYSEIQHYSIVAYDAEGKPLSSRQLDITPEVPDDGKLLEPANDRGERRQLMRHTEEAFRLAERVASNTSDRLVRENERLCNHSIAREAQLVTTTEKMCDMMIKFAEREHERAKLDLEIEKMRKREARIDRVLDMGARAIQKHYELEGPQAPLQMGAGQETKQATPAKTSPIADLLAVFNGLTIEQRVEFSKLLTPEQLAGLEKAVKGLEYAEHSQQQQQQQQQTSANGAKAQ